MSNPTSNFGWVMPTSTDLVTDLPADFEVFGQAVDTTLVDLKGGTSGQILSKASNTDMDFTWITNDVGDITGVTAGTGITGGGTSGAVTVSFDQANFGGGQWAAGKNKLINADFSINQRGFTTTSTGGGVYGFDRWLAVLTDGTTNSYSAQTFTAGTAPVAGYEAKNFVRLISAGQTLATAQTSLRQYIENVRTFAGQTITVSFWAKAASGTPKVALEVSQAFGSSGSANVDTYAGQATLTTSWARYSLTVAVPSISGKTIGTNNDALNMNFFVSAGTNFNARTGSLGIQSNTFDIWGVQAEAGSTATPFQTASGSIQGELAEAQRFYQKSYNQGVAVPTNSSFGGVFSGPGTSTATNGNYGFVHFPVVMRAAPTVTTYSYTSSTTSVISNAAGTDQAAGSGVASGIGDAGFGIYNSAAAVTTTNGWLIHYAANAEL